MTIRPFVCFILMLAMSLPAGCASGERETGTPSSLTFTRRTIVDSQGFGYEVFSILVPKDWAFRGQVEWRIENALPRPILTWSVSSPDGQVQVQHHPDMNFFWSNNPMMVQTYRMNGAAVAQPVSASDFLTGMFLPSRSGGSVQVVKQTPIPELAEYWRTIQEQLLLQVYHPISPLQTRPQLQAEAALIETSSGSDGDKHEQYLVVINRVVNAVPSMYGSVQTVSWNAVVTSFTAPESDRKEIAVPFGVMMNSAKLSPRWGVDCTRLTATCARNMLRQQQAIFNQMQQIRNTQTEISDMIMDGWEKRNAVMDGVYNRFSDYMRSTERYHDPIQDMRVDIPNTYDNAWTNGLDYVVSEDPSFNPNRTPDTRNWTRMERIAH